MLAKHPRPSCHRRIEALYLMPWIDGEVSYAPADPTVLGRLGADSLLRIAACCVVEWGFLAIAGSDLTGSPNLSGMWSGGRGESTCEPP